MADAGKDTMLPQAPGWGTPTFYAGIIVGLGLVAGGLAVQALLIAPGNQTALIVCSGLGIVLGAFGSVATVRYQGIVIAGVAAIAVALFVLLSSGTPRHVMISLANVPRTMAADLYVDRFLPRVKTTDDQYEFYMIGDTMGAQKVRLLLEDSASDAELAFDCIPARFLRPHLASGKTLEWWLEADQKALRIGTEAIQPGCLQDNEEASQSSTPNLPPVASLGFLLVSPAVAQGQPTLEPIEKYLADLNSTDFAIRRFARDGLAQWGLEAIEPMMDLWASDPTHYRNTLGVAVALTEFLRNNKDKGDQVASKLSTEDLALLTDAISHPDRTLRIYATEFLYDLGAPAAAGPLVEKFHAMTQEGQYNSVFVLNNVVPNLGSAEKDALAIDLQTWANNSGVGPNTKLEVNELLTKING